MNPSTVLAVSAASSFVLWSLLGLASAAAAGLGWRWARSVYGEWRRLHRAHLNTMLAVVTGLCLGAMLRKVLELLLG